MVITNHQSNPSQIQIMPSKVNFESFLLHLFFLSYVLLCMCLSIFYAAVSSFLSFHGTVTILHYCNAFVTLFDSFSMIVMSLYFMTMVFKDAVQSWYSFLSSLLTFRYFFNIILINVLHCRRFSYINYIRTCWKSFNTLYFQNYAFVETTTEMKHRIT